MCKQGVGAAGAARAKVIRGGKKKAEPSSKGELAGGQCEGCEALTNARRAAGAKEDLSWSSRKVSRAEVSLC